MRYRNRRTPLPVAAPVATMLMVIAFAAPAVAAGGAPAELSHTRGHGGLTSKQLAFHDAMRKLWEDHITWTRLAIVSFAGGLPDLAPTEQRLLRNQVDIGNAIKPYYGRAAARKLTTLLREHITGAVALLEAAKAGDSPKLAEAKSAWYANARKIADFLSSANPRNWPRGEMRAMMKAHLDETLQEAADRLEGKFEADIRDYEAVHRHILKMADMLSSGIMKQFPSRFRG
jgi:hypothetical protein